MVTENLARELKQSRGQDLLEVVVELHPNSSLSATSKNESRKEKAEAQRKAFEKAAISVVRAITDFGGEVLGTAWINQTIQARISAEGILRVADLDSVECVDTPRQIQLDCF